MKSAAVLQNGIFSLENQFFRRKWILSASGPYALSFSADGREWQIPGIQMPESVPGWTLQTEQGTDFILAELTSPDGITYRYKVYDSVPGFTCYPPEITAETHEKTENAEGVETAVRTGTEQVFYPEEWFPVPLHLKAIRFVLKDKSDQCDNTFRREEYRVYQAETLRLKGNLFAVENPENGTGILYLKHAPLPESRPVKTDFDMEFSSDGSRAPHLRRPVRLNRDGYPWTLLAYSGGQAGITDALHNFQQKLKPYRSGIDGMILSNTWGDRNRDMALSESFLLNELDLAAEIGIDVCQIDDGWQNGVTANSGVAAQNNGGSWNGGYHNAFWQVHPTRFPNGLSPLADRCRANGVGLGLWFSPDSVREFENWRKDSETLLAFNREYGVRHFKIDGITVTSRSGTERLQEFFSRTSGLSKDGLAFDLDVTAGQRPGYFGLDYPGALFLENRYSDFHSYFPYATFRNLWNLTHVIPPVNLRMEILNPDRNTALYEEDILAPVHYSMDWIFASVMVSSPLIWCELHGLSNTRKEELKRIIPVWKTYREELHTSVIHPAGEQPDGFRWSGYFASGRGAQHLIVLRDCAEDSEHTFTLPEPFSGTAEKLCGNGGIQKINGREITIRLPEKRSFVWFRNPVKNSPSAF